MGVVDIRTWLHSMNIYDYDICDGYVHVVGDVDISNMLLEYIPVKFGYVSGNFDCSNNNNLSSLEGCPKEVGGDFYCWDNKLTSLNGCPEVVSGDFYCYNNKLTSLEGCPVEVGKSFHCWGNNFKKKPDVGGIKIGGKFRWK